jgi:rod shape-determining protein MreD
MIDSAVLLLLGFFLIIIETTLFRLIPLGLLKVDFLLSVTIYLGFYRSPFKGNLLSFIFGYLLDTFSGSPMGLYAFLRVLSFSLSRLLSKKIFIEAIPAQMGVVFTLSIFDSLAMLIITKAIGMEIPELDVVFIEILRQAIILLLISPFLFILLRKLERLNSKYHRKRP